MKHFFNTILIVLGITVILLISTTYIVKDMFKQIKIK